MTAIELEIKEREAGHLDTIKELRLKNFSRNLPFMMLSENLPEGQVYREFADGRIEIQEVFIKDAQYRSILVRTLSFSEADNVRKEYGLC